MVRQALMSTAMDGYQFFVKDGLGGRGGQVSHSMVEQQGKLGPLSRTDNEAALAKQNKTKKTPHTNKQNKTTPTQQTNKQRQQEKRKLKESHISVYEYLCGVVKKKEPNSSQWFLEIGQEATDKNWNSENSI